MYHKPHTNQPRENNFALKIAEHLGADLIEEQYPTTQMHFDSQIDIGLLADRLSRDTVLPVNARNLCLESLRALPDKVMAAKTPKQVSHDLVIIENGIEFVVEFHEGQHRSLQDKRLKPIYDHYLNEYRIPRGLQRLIRDVWRIDSIADYTIVWFDWFEKNNHSFEFNIDRGFHEFSLPGSFSFKKFVSDI